MPRLRKLPREVYIGPGKGKILIVILEVGEFTSRFGDGCAGAWEKDASTIYLRSDFSLTRQWRAWREEMAHALLDSLAPEV